jgi:hypothetical protein
VGISFLGGGDVDEDTRQGAEELWVFMDVNEEFVGEEVCSIFCSNLGIQKHLTASTNLLLLDSIFSWRACFWTLVLQ